MVGGAGLLRRDQKGCWSRKRLRNATLDNVDLLQGWGTYSLSRAAWVVHYRWRATKSINFLLKFYLYLTMTKSDFSWLTICKYLLIIKLRFDAVLYSNLGNKNSDAGRIKCSHGPQVLHPWSTVLFLCNNIAKIDWRLKNLKSENSNEHLHQIMALYYGQANCLTSGSNWITLKFVDKPDVEQMDGLLL